MEAQLDQVEAYHSKRSADPTIVGRQRTLGDVFCLLTNLRVSSYFCAYENHVAPIRAIMSQFFIEFVDILIESKFRSLHESTRKITHGFPTAV